MNSLTAIIPTFNEAPNIEQAIKSVQWADEILIVDSFSTDETLKIAEQFDVKIVQRKYINSANQKNWIIPQATHPWVLLLDADERVTPALKTEIQQRLKQPITSAAFWIKRQNYFDGQKVNYSGWQGDAVIRLFKRDECRYEEKEVHAEIITKGTIEKLTQHLIHNTFRSEEHFRSKMARYAVWSARDHDSKTGKITVFHLFFKPLFRFLKHFVFQLGFLDGGTGYRISKWMAWGVKERYLEMKKLRAKR